MKQQLLLLEDVDALGKKGELVTARPGYFRNYLLPKGFAVVATPNVLRKQETLRKERAQQAIIDRAESETLAAALKGVSLEITVKVDPEGHMYGSVGSGDIASLFAEKGFSIEKKQIQLPRPIKATGEHNIVLKLKEGISSTVLLMVVPEGGFVQKAEAPAAEPTPAETPEESQ